MNHHDVGGPKPTKFNCFKTCQRAEGTNLHVVGPKIGLAVQSLLNCGMNYHRAGGTKSVVTYM